MSSKAKKAFDQGMKAAATNDVRTAEASFQQALNKDPNAYQALYNLGVLADRAGNERDANNYYRRALRALDGRYPRYGGASLR